MRTVHRFYTFTALKALLVLGGIATLPLQTAQATAGEPLAAQPALIAPLAPRSMLLDVVEAGDHLVAVGERGHILVSPDGVEWKQVDDPVNVMLTAVSFPDAKNGWAVGHDAAILHSADGGQTWTLQNFQPDLGQPLLDVYFADSRTGFAVGAFGLFMQTLDGGQSWEVITPPAVVDDGNHLNAITRLHDGSLLVVGEMGLMAVGDADGNWQKIESPYEGSLYAAEALGEHGVMIVGMRGNAYRTDDVRTGSWSKVETGTVQGLTGVRSLPDGTFAITGMNQTLLIVAQDGKVHRGEIDSHDPNGESGPFNSIVVHGKQVLVATHEGVRRAVVNP
ncbi:hypothetical protein E4T66_00690 [Sinimarinibacterium sp. CAU 1509]|uniref:WD40/YVTN/BNR-like repeat-containing protein n=1 Tax=Sinimarinibacterium sp. CAU 1509 TaxID=2562283 RepID=UPI0010ABB82F|nr:YCF48-related protein [Sinimarinibacterium sp. CAU 1509]TJY64795.1 hypothetical protein E4T66_00690 [Sinimarinibacterium sp. CAU 1509]